MLGVGWGEGMSRNDVADGMHFLLSKGPPYFVHAELVSDVEQTEVCEKGRKLVDDGRVQVGTSGSTNQGIPLVCGVGRGSAIIIHGGGGPLCVRGL